MEINVLDMLANFHGEQLREMMIARWTSNKKHSCKFWGRSYFMCSYLIRNECKQHDSSLSEASFEVDKNRTQEMPMSSLSCL